MARRISYSRGRGKSTHNNRELIADNVDVSRTKDNIIIKDQPLDEAYKEIFGVAQSEYNSKQKRKDRRIDDYFDKLFGCSATDNKATEIITNDNKQQSFYEWVIGIGSSIDTALVDWTDSKGNEYKADLEAARTAALCLKEYMLGSEELGIPSYEQRNPNFHVVQAIIHMDEHTPHLHKEIVPFCDGYKKGMTRQQSISKALEAMGYGIGETAILKWQQSERDVFETICKAHGFEVAVPEKGRGYDIPTRQYSKWAELERATRAEQEKLDDLTEQEQRKQEEIEQHKREAAQQAVQATQAEARLEAMQEQEQALQSRTESLQSEIDTLLQNRDVLSEQEQVLQSRTEGLQGEIGTLTQNRDALQEQVDDLEFKKTGVLRNLVRCFRAKRTIQAAEQIIANAEELEEALTEEKQKELEKARAARQEAEDSRDAAALHESEIVEAKRQADKLLEQAEQTNAIAKTAYEDRLDEAEDEIQQRIKEGVEQGINDYLQTYKDRFATLDRQILDLDNRIESKQQALRRLGTTVTKKSIDLYTHPLYRLAESNSEQSAERIKAMRDKSQGGQPDERSNTHHPKR